MARFWRLGKNLQECWESHSWQVLLGILRCCVGIFHCFCVGFTDPGFIAKMVGPKWREKDLGCDDFGGVFMHGAFCQ